MINSNYLENKQTKRTVKQEIKNHGDTSFHYELKNPLEYDHIQCLLVIDTRSLLINCLNVANAEYITYYYPFTGEYMGNIVVRVG